MTDRKQALTDLLELVTDGVDFSEVGYSDFSNAFPAVQSGKDGPWDNDRSDCAIKAYNGSLDAALALYNAVLNGWDVSLGASYAEVADYPNHCGVYFICNNDSPARAWLIAIIEALISQEDAQ